MEDPSYNTHIKHAIARSIIMYDSFNNMHQGLSTHCRMWCAVFNHVKLLLYVTQNGDSSRYQCMTFKFPNAIWLVLLKVCAQFVWVLVAGVQ